MLSKGIDYRRLMKKLCVGCGVCIGLCPKDAISSCVINGYASINFNESKCISCNLCTAFCPIISYAISKSELSHSSSNVIEVFLGYSTDAKVRYSGASGGVVTSILTFLLERGEVDGVLVVKTKGKKYVPYIARDPKDLRDAQGSIYFPTFAMKILRELMRTNEHYAVVGLPCQIDALKKLLNHGVLPPIIKYFLGLRCFQTFAPWYLDYIIERMLKLPKNEVYEVSARKSGWPGKVIVKSKSGNYSIPHFYDKKSGIGLWNPLGVGHFNAQRGCLICTNHENFNSDVTFGDAWLPEIMERDSMGTSLIVIRTLKGSRIIRQAAADGYIVIQPMQKHIYMKLTVDKFKIQRRILMDFFTKRSLIEITQKWGLSSIVMLPYMMIILSSFREMLLSLPPKILMRLINHYLHIAQKIL
ncbi:MAG: Coenzyme F420 hydrogenase/dehydrogenase, beta subunit C-terminal domain [Candidatus Bathyarchaeia archaeon]